MNIHNFYYPDGLPDPITRREVYLSAAAGANATLPDPITREEVYLKAIAEGGGGGLPSVTAADNGKVLGVKDGVWDAVTKTLHVPIIKENDTEQHLTNFVVPATEAAAITENLVENASSIYFDFYESGSSTPIAMLHASCFSLFSFGISSRVMSCKITSFIKPLYSSDGWENPDTLYLSFANKEGGGNWVASANVTNVLEIVLTPTSQDMSGTMNYDPDKILEAYRNGARIRAKIPSLNAEFDFTQFIVANGTIICCGSILYGISGQDVLIKVVTAPDAATYSTTIYPLTAM